jgi:hypothetical protein
VPDHAISAMFIAGERKGEPTSTKGDLRMSEAKHWKRDEAIARDVLKNGSNLDRHVSP